ncbi:capping protein, Arp2/3 and myosin-I linker protein 3 isoform X1 [Larimichthys crocea]|uniref:capping protein, Arp2/3 and myosin-I linker protein 3 isoform X1 n=2 Tax=Larimichthys crocea TaxID=215358 RepID=UPI000F6006AA|nr:capping protein, Arp2/3 and myosin-I linker protein 3 isoform X1 [Larimichthys crocea]XP_027138984.1 capping protein, Arp2/3 and myosin-I linker protein 3 isoform X1 [Larimichthys crocea]
MASSKETTAAGFVNVSREITESIRKVLDKQAIKFVRAIKQDTRSGKSEDRILVLATWRLYLFAVKVPTKMEVTFNFLEIRAMNTYPEHQVVIDTDKTTYSLRLQTQDQLDHMVSHINYALSRVFNNSIYAPPICRAEGDLTDGSCKFSPNSESSLEPHKTCGGFSETYAALCDYNGIGCKEEVQWDVDTIYHSQDNREFNLMDFSHLDSRDLAVIVASIAYNTWFTKLYCKDMRIGSEVVDQVLHTVSKSNSLEELTLENAGLKSDFPQKMASALSENPASVIHSLNLAHNTLDNQGVSNLIQQVCRLNKGLRLLNLSKTSLSSKGVVSLSQALCSSDDYSNSLLHLDLSKNPGVLSGEDATNLYLFLAQPNCLVHLDLSGTDCTVDSLFGALLRGCCADLSYLNLSKNSFSHRKARDSLPTFRQFFSSAFSLTHVSLSSMKVPPDSLRALFLGLSNNPHITDLHLDISSCELRSAGAGVIQELFPRVSCVGTLDISDNGLDADLLAVIPAFSRHPSLKHLMLGKNFNIKGRVLDEILQKLVHLVQEEECALQSLSLADSRLRQRGTVLVNALGSNTCLRKVDLSGNLLEDSGAKMLSKALQINTTLRSVTWDRNNTTATGFQDVARALEHNFTLQYMPVPLSDVTQAYRSAPEKTDQALTKIQRALLRNNQTQRFSQKQALRLHQGLVTSTAEQVMERLCVRVQQQVCVLKGCEEGEEVQTARQILKEARDSRALYPSLCELAHVLSVDGPVKQRLDTLAGELAKAADKELQVVVDSMVSLCRELCPMSCSAAERLSPPLSSISEQVSIPRSAIRNALMERAAEDINRALEEVKLSVVSYLTNSIVDQILQELYTTHKTLVLLRQVSQAKRWDDVGTGRRTIRQSRIIESLEFPDEDFGVNLGIDTMAIKKRSSRTRRIRPVSTRLSLGDEPSPSPTPSAPPHSAPLAHSASWECLSTLPTNGSPLRHVTHVRPRPPRRHRAGHLPPESREAQSTRFHKRAQKGVEHCSENGGVNMMEDGLPDFYSKRVLPDSQLSSLHQAQSLRRKKRRSVLSIFSGFRKNRNSTISNQDSDSALENVYSMIQHPKDAGRPESTVPGANGTMSSPRPTHGVPGHGMRAASPPCLIQRQSTDLVSMVYSCIGAEIEDSDGSSTCDIKVTDDTDRATAISDAPADTRNNGHVLSSKQQTDRQMETGRQERIVPLTDSQTEMEDNRQSGGGNVAPCGTRPEPPPQSTKPSLSAMRQRHLQESLEEAGRLMGEEHSETKHEDKQRPRGPEGQRPLLLTKPSLDLSRAKTTPEKAVTSPKTSPLSPREEPSVDQRGLPAAQPIIQEEGSAERRSPPASAQHGVETADPASQGEEKGRNGVPHTRKSNSFDIGMERDSPYDLERSSDRRFPVKKPCFPQYRNRSLDCPAGTRCYESPQLDNRDVL